MKKSIKAPWLILAVLAVCGARFGTISWAQDKKAPDKEKPPAVEKKDAKAEPKEKTEAKSDTKDKAPTPADMESWMKLASAGEQHKKLDGLVGTWKLLIKYPGEEGTDSKGTAEFRWVMDGRFLVESTKTDMSGQLFEWMGWHGYDNQKKQYVSVWIDNFGTGIESMTGQFDDAKKTLTYIGEADNPEAGGKVKVKWTIHLESKDRFTVEMREGTGNGHDKTVMQIVATRG